MHKVRQDTLGRHIVWVVVLKFVLLALLWWLFVREQRSDPRSAGVAQALLPAPFVMPSSSHAASSLTAWDAVSSRFTLGLMLVATLVFLPRVLVYTGWAYRVMRGKVTAAYIRENEHSAY